MLTWSVAELTLVLAIVLLFGGVPLWLTWRSRRMRHAALGREADLLAQVAAQQAVAGRSGNETVLAGMPTRMIVRGGIEVKDVTEVVDLDALLAGVIAAGGADLVRLLQVATAGTGLQCDRRRLVMRAARALLPFGGSALRDCHFRFASFSP